MTTGTSAFVAQPATMLAVSQLNEDHSVPRRYRDATAETTTVPNFQLVHHVRCQLALSQLCFILRAVVVVIIQYVALVNYVSRHRPKS